MIPIKDKYKICVFNRDIGPAVRMFANGPGDLGSIESYQRF